MADDNTLENIIFGLKQTIAENNQKHEEDLRKALEDNTKEILTELSNDKNVEIMLIRDYWGEEYAVAVVRLETINNIAKSKYGVDL